MNDKDRLYDYLKYKRKIYWIGQYIDIALILTLWFTGLRFWAVAVLIISVLGIFAMTENLKKHEREVFGKVM